MKTIAKVYVSYGASMLENFYDRATGRHGESMFRDKVRYGVKRWVNLCLEFDMDPQWREAMETVGGDSRHWYVFHGVVKPDWITDITHFNEETT